MGASSAQPWSYWLVSSIFCDLPQNKEFHVGMIAFLWQFLLILSFLYTLPVFECNILIQWVRKSVILNQKCFFTFQWAILIF